MLIIFNQRNNNMRQTYLVTLILINLVGLYLTDSPPPNTTPTDWTQGAYTSACTTMDGVSKEVQDESSGVPLTNDYIYLKSSSVFNRYLIEAGYAYTQSIFKYYIQISSGGDGLLTNLQISNISAVDGTIVTQTYSISSTYQFIDADGPYCLLQQTYGSGNAQLTLYSFDSTPGATALSQLTANSISTYPNEIFKSVSVSNGDSLQDSNYNGIIGTVVSINTVTTKAIVRPILSTGLDTPQYSFAINSINSDVYVNLLLGLQISESNFYTYLSPLTSSGLTPPFDYSFDSTAIATSSGMFSNHIVIPFIYSMMIATYDDAGQNGNVFFLQNDWETYDLSLVNMKTTLTASSGSLQYFTDYSSYIIELNVDPTVSTFYIVWADDQVMFNYTFLNSFGDNKNNQIVTDFSHQLKMSSLFYGQDKDDSTYGLKLYFWLYSSTGIIKYVLNALVDGSGTVTDISINKEFSVELADNLLVNSIGSNFQITTQLKCICQTAQVTEMICFYGNDACTFTIQTFPTYCTPA